MKLVTMRHYYSARYGLFRKDCVQVGAISVIVLYFTGKTSFQFEKKNPGHNIVKTILAYVVDKAFLILDAVMELLE